MICLRLLDNPVKWLVQNQNVVKGPSRGVLCEADGGSGVRLGITIDEESGLFGGGEAGGQVHRSSCLAYSTFLVCDGDDSSQISPRQRKSSKPGTRMQDVYRGTSSESLQIRAEILECSMWHVRSSLEELACA